MNKEITSNVVSKDIPPQYYDYSIPVVREEDIVRMRGMEVYAPKSFKATTMLLGDRESSVALCTSWTDPWQVVPGDRIETFHTVAPLRTPVGINIMLWNLARNPQIRHLGIWAGDELDKTPRGKVSVEYLKTLWSNGVDDDGTVKETSFMLLPELVENGGIEIVRKVLENVELYDWTGREGDSLGEFAEQLPRNESYMESHVFPEFEIRAPETFPSEEVAFEIREERLYDAWMRLVDRIMRYGNMTQLETGGALVRELEFARVVIGSENVEDFYFPDWVGEISELKLTREGLDEYYKTKVLPHNNLIEIYPGVLKFDRGRSKYLYSELMFFFPRSKTIDEATYWILEKEGVEAVYNFLSENSEVPDDRRELAKQVLLDQDIDDDRKRAEIVLEILIPPVNQVAKAIERIKTMPDDADKTIVLWDPTTHGMQDRGRPCLIYASLLVRDGRVDMQTTWRSHDIAKGWPENLYGMLRLQDYITEQTGYERGSLISTSESAHIYQGDLSWVESVWQRQLVDVKVRKVFEPEEDADPRGNTNITVDRDQIVFILQEPESGAPLIELRGTFKDIFYNLKQLDLLSSYSHWMDVGSELQKAEMSRLLNIPYVQDKPIDFRRLRQ